MKIISDTLEPLVETWDDPGDYPSGAGSGPLPSYQYYAGIEGELRVELSSEEATELRAWLESKSDLGEWIERLEISLPAGILSSKWDVELVDGSPAIAVLTSTDSEPDPDYQVSDNEPDYEPDYEWER